MSPLSVPVLLESCGWVRRTPTTELSHFGTWVLPGDYVCVLAWTNGGSARLGRSSLSLLELWSAQSLPANQSLVEKYMPACFSIGGDGGSREFVVDYRTGRPGPILSVDRGDLGWDCDTLRVLGADLTSAIITLRDIPLEVDSPDDVGHAA